jgi:hypothetical protein
VLPAIPSSFARIPFKIHNFSLQRLPPPEQLCPATFSRRGASTWAIGAYTFEHRVGPLLTTGGSEHLFKDSVSDVIWAQEAGAHMNAASLLEYVLASSDDRLDPVRQSLSGTKPAILEIPQGDGESLLDIYSTRAEIAELKGRSGENSRDLITNMKKDRPKRITILHVGTSEEVFLVFTDSGNRKIIGVIPGHVAGS